MKELFTGGRRFSIITTPSYILSDRAKEYEELIN
jgi:hypothetical protein